MHMFVLVYLSWYIISIVHIYVHIYIYTLVPQLQIPWHTCKGAENGAGRDSQPEGLSHGQSAEMGSF